MPKLPHMQSPCGNCPFRKDSLKHWLGEKRITQILNTGSFVCHKKTKLQCAGHMLIKGHSNSFMRLARALNIDIKLNGGGLIFKDKKSCIEHHKERKA